MVTAIVLFKINPKKIRLRKKVRTHASRIEVRGGWSKVEAGM